MDCVLRTPQCAVFDNVLPPDQFESLWKYIQMTEYESVHAKKWEKVWRMHDGQVFRGPLIKWNQTEQETETTSPGEANELVYPTQTIIDNIMELILSQAIKHPQLIGSRLDDWQTMVAHPYLYPVGSGLSWHADGGRYTGAFSFYCHPEWNSLYGGELMISEADTKRLREILPSVLVYEREGNEITTLEKRQVPPFLDNSAEDKLLSQADIGLYISPKPNRLVLLKGSTYHQVKAVTPVAGRFSRATLAGFFVADKSSVTS